MADTNVEGGGKELKVGGHSAVLRGQSVKVAIQDMYLEYKV